MRPLSLHTLFACLLLLAALTCALPMAAFAEEEFEVVDVSFHGNESVSAGDLKKVMIMRPSGFLGLFNDTVYDEGILREDLEYIELYYQQHGWREAKVVDHEVEIDSADTEVRISITVSEGPQTTIADILPLGNEHFSNEKIIDMIPLEAGDPLNRIKLRRGAEKIARNYAEEGFLDAKVNPSVIVDPEVNEAFIDVVITEDTQFRVGQIIMAGADITEWYVIRRELEFKSGQVLTLSRLSETQRNLYETGLFRSAFVRQEDSIAGDSTLKDVLVEVTEQKPIIFSASAGYATLEKLRGSSEIHNENLWGTGRGTGVKGWISFIDRGIQLSYTEPWVFGIPWTADLKLTGEYRDDPNFDWRAYGARLTFSRRIFGKGFFSVSYRHENAWYFNIDIADFSDETEPRIRSLSQSFSYDTRNDPFTPTTGWLGTLSNEYALQFLGSTNEFFKTRTGFRYFYPWDDKTVLASNIELGWVDAGGGITDIPLGERLYAGGPAALRGFTYRGVGPVDDDDLTPTGGRAKIVWNMIEVRHMIWTRLGLVGFLDVGNVFEQVENVKPTNFRWSPGAGVRVATPVGLIRFDVGWNAFPKEGEDDFAFHFSVGHAF